MLETTSLNPTTLEGLYLPNDWRRVQLKEVCEVNPRRLNFPARSDNEPTTFVQMAAVDDREGIIARPEVKPYSDVKKGYTFFTEGDVLFAIITPCMQNGKHAIARNLIDGIGFGSTEFHVLHPTESVLSEWIHFFVRQPSVLKAAMAHFTGAVGQQRVPEGFLATLEIPLPPLSEQERIAATLKEQMAAVERARAAAEAQLKAAKDLPAAYLREVFDNSEARQWQKKRIGDVAKVQSGYAFKSDWFSSDGIRLLRNANIFQGFISWGDTVRLSMNRRAEFETYEMAEGDIVLSLDRPLVSNGLKVARLTSNDVPSLLLQRVGRFRLLDDIDADYLYAFLNSEKFIKAITSHDQSLGVPHVSPAQVEAVEIPLPSLTEQQQITKKLSQKIRTVEQTSKILKDQLDTVEKIPAALLRQAFTGKL